jgi:hypothetical protein
MKRIGTLLGLMLVILLAGSGCHRARTEKGDMRDPEKVAGMRMNHDMGMHWMKGNNRHNMRDGMRRGMGPGMDNMIGMRQGMEPGMMNRMGRMPMDSLGWTPAGPGRRMLESIPNVTENQKKQIKDLMMKHQEEMKKIREEMNSKMQSLMEAHRKDMLNIMTEEQKKYIESDRNKTIPLPDKTR